METKTKCGNIKCKQEFAFQLSRKQNSMNGKKFTDIGVECPHCNSWFHSYYETLEVKRANNTLKAKIKALKKRLSDNVADIKATDKLRDVKIAAANKWFNKLRKGYRDDYSKVFDDVQDKIKELVKNDGV